MKIGTKIGMTLLAVMFMAAGMVAQAAETNGVVEAPVAASAQIAPGVVGDGVHDDTAGLQALLDSGRTEVRFPDPKVCLSITRTLKIHSCQSLVLSPSTVVRLLPRSNTVMITNDDHNKGNSYISVTGGIWDMDNQKQDLCSYHRDSNWHGEYRPDAYIGVLMRFNNVTNLTLRSLTLKDPESYGTQLGNLNRFTIEDITFDYNLKRGNMDGIHVHGNSRNGRIANVKGPTNDDAVALNADDAGIYEMCRGPIEDVEVDGVFGRDSYTGVRLLSAGSPIRRVTIQNLHGSWRYNGVSFTNHKVHPGSASTFEDIVIRNVMGSKSNVRMTADAKNSGPLRLGLIWIDAPAVVSSLSITDLHRTERTWPAENIAIEAGATVNSLQLNNITVINHTPGTIPVLTNKGRIGRLAVANALLKNEQGAVRGGLLANTGTIEQSSLQNASVVNAAASAPSIQPVEKPMEASQ